MLRSLISALRSRARRVSSQHPLGYRHEPMPRLRWYQ